MKDRDVLRWVIPRINAAFLDVDTNDELRVWKCHRYDHSVERTLCSTLTINRRQFQVFRPRICPLMGDAFEYLPDHIEIRLKGNEAARLTIDFAMFSFFARTQHGLSITASSDHIARRLWRFMELLADGHRDVDGEVDARIVDLGNGGTIDVTVDVEESRYLNVKTV